MNFSSDSRLTARCFATSLVLCCATASPLVVAAEEGVLMTGYNVQYSGPAAAISDSALSRETLCGPDGATAMLNSINQVANRLDERVSSGGWSEGDRQAAVVTTITEMCQGNESFSLEAYAMTYAECRMTMDTASMFTDISMPPGNAPAAMTMGDMYRAEASRITFDRSMDAAGSIGATMGDINWVGPEDSKQVAGLSGTRWNFNYETGLGGGALAGLASMGMSTSITTTGHGYFSSSVPGMDTVQAFFDNFASQIDSGQSSSSMFGGMLKTMVQMLEKGVPLEMETTVSSNMRGPGGMSMRSGFKATGVQRITLADDMCSRNLVPDYFAVTDMNEQLEGMGGMAGAAQGMTPEQQEQMQEGMAGFSEAMAGMSDEQKEALAGFGLGSIAGMGAQQPAAAPANQPAAAPPSSGPGSESLMTDNLVQSIQLHLQALDIDPGNTDGNMDLNTQIAISQFQASKGMEVTGEESPQLLGALAAEVDSK